MEDGCLGIYRWATYLKSGGFYRPLDRKIVYQAAWFHSKFLCLYTLYFTQESNPKKNCTAFTKINCIFLSDYCRNHHRNVYTKIRHPRDYSAPRRAVVKGIFMTAEQNHGKCVTCALPFRVTVCIKWELSMLLWTRSQNIILWVQKRQARCAKWNGKWYLFIYLSPFCVTDVGWSSAQNNLQCYSEVPRKNIRLALG